MVERLVAPAKLTRWLRVNGRRPDGLHEISAEMVCISLADELYVDPEGDRLEVTSGWGSETDTLPPSDASFGLFSENLVHRALRALGRRASVRLVKRIPVGGGLGGGSSDAAAILRWAGNTDPAIAASLGADVPFCVVGGRARVGGIGEVVSPLDYEARAFVLLLVPFGVETGAVYAAFDESRAARCEGREHDDEENDLMAPALRVEPRLALWRDLLADVTGALPVLAGSGSTWFVELDTAAISRVRATVRTWPFLTLGDEEARLVPVTTVPTGWTGSPGELG